MSSLYFRLKRQIRGWLPKDPVASYEPSRPKHVRVFWYLLIIAVLGILIYVPVIPHSAQPIPAGAGSYFVFPNQGNVSTTNQSLSLWCYGCGMIQSAPYLNSLTMQFLNFGSRYFETHGTFQFCINADCVGGLAGTLLWGDLLVAIAAIDVALLASFILTKEGLRGASFQLGLGALAAISPALLLILGVEPMWLNTLMAEEITNAGAVLILAAIAEMWWFRWIKNNQYNGNSKEFEFPNL